MHPVCRSAEGRYEDHCGFARLNRLHIYGIYPFPFCLRAEHALICLVRPPENQKSTPHLHTSFLTVKVV